MPRDLIHDKSILVQVMAWCLQATSHYLSQCYPSYMSPYGVTRPQWVITLQLRQNGSHFGDHIFKLIFLHKNWRILNQISLICFLRVQLKISQHWLRQCFGSKQVMSHYLNHWWWPSLLTHLGHSGSRSHRLYTPLGIAISYYNIVC